MIIYAGYDSWYDFDEICDFLNYHVPGFHVSVSEKKDFRKALKADVPNQIYKRHTWWKQDDLSKFFCEKFPKVNFAHAFRTYDSVNAIKHFADEEWFKEEYVHAHRVMAECAAKIIDTNADDLGEISEKMMEYQRAKIAIEVLVNKFLPKDHFAYKLHLAFSKVYHEEGYGCNIYKQMLYEVMDKAKESKKFDGETLADVLSRKQKGERNGLEKNVDSHK